MHHLGARLQAGERCAARIGKEVEHLHRPAGRADHMAHQIPVDRLLRKEPRMFKAHRFDVEPQGVIADLPHIRQPAIHLPPPTAR